MLPSFREWLTAAEAGSNLQHSSFPAPPPDSLQLPVLVVGAGPGGLCVMAELSRRLVPFVCMEQHTGVGGIWDVTSEHSPMYEGLSCNASRYSMTLDKPWDLPKDGPLFPTDRELLIYLNQYADKHDLRRHCRFGRRVEQATFDEQQQCWTVRYRQLASGEEREERFADLVAATGANASSGAWIPDDLASQCKAAQLPYCHAAAVKQPADYSNKRVLVVGLGITGADLATQLALHTDKVYLAVRTPPYIVTIAIYGQPLDKLIGGDMPNLTALPKWASRAVLWCAGGLLKRVVSAMTTPWEQYGLKRPEYSPLDRVPVADDGSFRAALRDGRVRLRNQAGSFSAGRVHYDNTPEKAGVDCAVDNDDIDCVVFCTGYNIHHPFLPSDLAPGTRRPVHIPTGRYPDLGQLTPHTQTSNLTFLLFSPRNAHLYFMTEVHAGFAWMVFQEQAKAIVATIVARKAGTERIRRFDRVVAFPNIAFTGPLLGGEHVFVAGEEMVAEQSLYSAFLRQYVAWVESGK